MLSPGDTAPPLSAEDQHGAAFAMSSAERVLLVSFDMASGKAANSYLAAQDADYLERHQAVFVANIHGMPGVGKFFALRKMRSYPHRIVLNEQQHALDAIPREEGSVTVIRIGKDGRVSAIDFWRPEAQPLDEFLE
jgi:hypothetical protein